MRLVRDIDFALARQVGAGKGFLAAQDVFQLALGDDSTAVDPGAGADIDNVIGLADGVLVVLHHQHRVAQVPQVGEGAQQALVVALVQAY